MGKRNKIRYQAKVKDKVLLTISGNVYLRYEEEEEIEAAKKGDLLVYPQNESLNTTREGDYYSTGFSGYFKVDVNDGKQWCAVLLNDIFPDKENHFAKSELPIDTYGICKEILITWAGKRLERTYREHYQPEESEE